MTARTPPPSAEEWLDPRQTKPAALQSLLVPASDDALEAIPISNLVSNPDNDSPELLARVEEPEPEPTPGEAREALGRLILARFGGRVDCVACA